VFLEADEAQRLADARFQTAVQRRHEGAEVTQILLRGERLEQGEALGAETHPWRDLAIRDRATENLGPACSGREQSAEDADQGGFARAVGTEKAEKTPRFDGEIYSLQGEPVLTRVGETQLLELDCSHRNHDSSSMEAAATTHPGLSCCGHQLRDPVSVS